METSEEVANRSGNDSKLLKLANAAGFLFQLRIAHEVSSTYQTHRKSVLATEHRWVDSETGKEGFIDLVITTGTNAKMVVECKRVKDAQWVFLVPQNASSVRQARVLWTMRLEDDRQIAAWDEFILNPDSMESMFCVVRGQGERDRPMLERLSNIVLRSAESLAEEEIDYQRVPGLPGIRLYFPVILTTASLHICRYEPLDIDLSTGLLESGEFEEVPFIRFTKSLSTRIPTSRPPSNLTESAEESLRTVFVINANNLASVLLGKWEFRPPLLGGPWPWGLPKWETPEATSERIG